MAAREIREIERLCRRLRFTLGELRDRAPLTYDLTIQFLDLRMDEWQREVERQREVEGPRKHMTVLDGGRA